MLISGSGNVAQFAAIKCREFGAQVLSFSDSNGTIIEPNGFSDDQIQELIKIKERRGRCSEYKSATAQYHEGKRPWKLVNCDVALPSATQNELEEDDAQALVKGGCKYVFEGANMPSTPAAINVLKPNAVYFPAKVIENYCGENEFVDFYVVFLTSKSLSKIRLQTLAEWPSPDWKWLKTRPVTIGRVMKSTTS